MNIPADVKTGQRTGKSSAHAWSYFDRIYCISLANRTDRRAQAQAEFHRVGLDNRVEFMIVDKHPTNSEQGIFESHTACLRAALAAGARTILIFEDDVLFRRFSPDMLDRAIRFMESDIHWDLFFFGCFVKASSKTPFRSILKVQFRCAAHAYVISRKVAEKMLEKAWQGTAYDDALRSMGKDVYVVYPAFAFQSNASTDNDQLLGVDRVRRLVGGVRWAQRWNEFSTRHFATLVVVHVVIVLLMILAIVLGRRGHWLHHTITVPSGH